MSANERTPNGIPAPRNEVVKSYAPGTPERASLKAELERMAADVVEIPLVIGDERRRTGQLRNVVMPHDHRHVIAKAHNGSAADVEAAIAAAEAARPEWSSMAFEDRAAVLLKAADLLSGPYRDRINAATMLGQSKTAHQAEIDSACELVDFWRWNVHFAAELAQMQPISPPGQWNRVELRPLDGFVFAITPFNFTAISGNLPTAPAIVGNTVVWKPAAVQILAAHVIMEVLHEAGLPPGVINLVTGNAGMISSAILASPRLGGIHFTGSTDTFNELWSTVGKNIARYHQYPRLVGETGGKDFIFAHASADVDALVTAIVRGGFEYQGQKCSAASRVFVPRSLAKIVREKVAAEVATIKVGDVRDFSNFMGAVIDERAYVKLSGFVDRAKADGSCTLIAGGRHDASRGYFIDPTVVEVSDPSHVLMKEELFGPVVTMWTYDDAKEDEALTLVDTSTPYALTGAIFARDRRVIAALTKRLRGAAGNFYVNDKPTGAVVGQQPFGGSRGSGTNDKAGSAWNLMRWVSPRAIKETFDPPKDYRYPFLAQP
ncbi:L-glutamate gamma-semialdehyde dehydrogenase [Myxococcota bacterium]|nr:L-glutamate gamma-semialdehyde dehydrogenase [Myxococcota bacterium]